MIYQNVSRMIAEILGLNEEDITHKAVLRSDYGMKPIEIAKLVIECEKQFNITIHDEDVHTFHCTDDVVLYIEKLYTH